MKPELIKAADKRYRYAGSARNSRLLYQVSSRFGVHVMRCSQAGEFFPPDAPWAHEWKPLESVLLHPLKPNAPAWRNTQAA
jgi:hypothetical protein